MFQHPDNETESTIDVNEVRPPRVAHHTEVESENRLRQSSTYISYTRMVLVADDE